MTLRLLALATTAALLTLAGCATQQSASDPVESLNQRLSSIESRLQAEAGSTHELIGEFGKKVATLSGELRRIQETGASQASDSAAARQALAARLDKVEQRAEQRLQNLASETQAAAAQAAGVQAALPALTAKVDGTGQRLDELAAQTRTALNQAAGVHAALPELREKAAEAGPRLDDYDARLAALNKRLEEVARMARDAFDATGLGQRKIFGKVIESITLTEDKTLFPINSPNLGEQDKAKLDALAVRLKDLGTNYHLQIQGHTEGFGSDDYNYELGKARAEAVKNYLNEKGGIPLLRMSVMSYGSLESTGYATKSNRRIVVQVLQ